jgi:hypothetical protein
MPETVIPLRQQKLYHPHYTIDNYSTTKHDFLQKSSIFCVKTDLFPQQWLSKAENHDSESFDRKFEIKNDMLQNCTSIVNSILRGGYMLNEYGFTGARNDFSRIFNIVFN